MSLILNVKDSCWPGEKPWFYPKGSSKH